MHLIREYINLVEANFELSRAYALRSWFRPQTNEWVRVTTSHAKAVAKNPEIFGLDFEPMDTGNISDRSPDLMNSACANGWVRIASQDRQNIEKYMIFEGADLDSLIRVAKMFYFDQKGRTENVGLKVRSLDGDSGKEYMMIGNGAVKGALLQHNLPPAKSFGTNGGYIMAAEGMITELMDAPYSVKPNEMSNRAEFIYDFTSDSGEKYIITLYKMKAFNGVTIAFSTRKTYSPTGTGDAYRIYATVLKVLKDYIANENPSRIFFSSSPIAGQEGDSSRNKLYDAFAKALPRVLPDFKFVDKKNYGGLIEWSFIRKDHVNERPSLGESFMAELANGPANFAKRLNTVLSRRRPR